MAVIISIGSDHAGFELKQRLIQFLKNKGYQLVDKGCNSTERADYPDYAHSVASDIIEKISDVGILLCGSGNGIAMAANKHKGIRAAICWTSEVAVLARQHNDANILVLPARFIDDSVAFDCVEAFLKTTFEGGRHSIRINKIDILN